MSRKPGVRSGQWVALSGQIPGFCLEDLEKLIERQLTTQEGGHHGLGISIPQGVVLRPSEEKGFEFLKSDVRTIANDS
jgi:hypothetical protein